MRPDLLTRWPGNPTVEVTESVGCWYAGDLPGGQHSSGRDRPSPASRACGNTRSTDLLRLRRLDDDAAGRVHSRGLGRRTVWRLASVRIVDDLRPVPNDHQWTGRSAHVQRRLSRHLRLLRHRTCSRSSSFSADPYVNVVVSSGAAAYLGEGIAPAWHLWKVL